MIAYSAFNRGSNYELISSTIDGEISATSRVEIVHVDMPLAYLIKAIFIKDATSLRKRMRKSLHLQKFIKSVRRSSIIRASSTIHANSYPILPLHYDLSNIQLCRVWWPRPIQHISVTWHLSKNIMQISYYINKVWRWIIFAINNTEGHFASSRPAECALGRTSRASYSCRDLLSRQLL